MNINLYDFDNTIYNGDSSTHFFFYSLKKYPRIIKVVPKIISYALKYKLNKCSKTEMKEVIFSFVKYIPDIDTHIDSFWNTHKKNIKKFYMETKHDKDVIISASPEFLLKSITEELGVKLLIGSKVDKKTGKFTGLNCHGEEKVVRLNKELKKYKVMSAYSDSFSDIPILKLAKKQYLVKGNGIIEVFY